MELA
ncbi:AMP-binding enzyme family protein, partial [Vibrio parahaemolyticus V-223/04]|jgi:hypothetical protein